MSFLSKQFIDILQWPNPPANVLSARYEMEGQEIQTGAKLVVRETQAALFLNEGQVADLFGPGTHTLTTQTLPLLTYLMNWDKAFQSPFKSDVFFFNLREQVDQKWGTTQPITVRDKEFGPLRIRAFGNYAFKISDPRIYWTRFCGSGTLFRVADIEGQLRAAILTGIASCLGSAEIAFVDMAAQQVELSKTLQTALTPTFTEMGLALTAFNVQSLSLPEELETHLDRAVSQRIMGNLSDYTRFQAAEALGTASSQPGNGLAGGAMELGAGLSMGQIMAGALNASLNSPAFGHASAMESDPMALLEKLGELHQKGILTDAEFAAKKAEILSKIK
ncbi:SPFH domain-containing protein [Asticcacaulis sp. 201]|uniref:SPFH domain-containing protein n=1 Tax=Asticcacaulis sp. 201 TaxID=3028787 RepID=UPI002916B29E|nr:SPFH domain-containing protein [Asticcacaulis sp. 201]MDV6333252.1 SPFH domain-containing protein [Asticcacaulis sp. 201]